MYMMCIYIYIMYIFNIYINIFNIYIYINIFNIVHMFTSNQLHFQPPELMRSFASATRCVPLTGHIFSAHQGLLR